MCVSCTFYKDQDQNIYFIYKVKTIGPRVKDSHYGFGPRECIASIKVPIKIEVQTCVCLYVVYESVKGSGQPRVREMDEEVEPQTLIYIC